MLDMFKLRYVVANFWLTEICVLTGTFLLRKPVTTLHMWSLFSEFFPLVLLKRHCRIVGSPSGLVVLVYMV
jgi:hypothetical protein